MKKLLLLITVYIVSTTATGKGLESSTIRRTLALEILIIACEARIIPTILVPLLYDNKKQVQRHAEAFLEKLRTEVSNNHDFLHDYLELLSSHSTDNSSIVENLYTMMVSNADQYVIAQKGANYSGFKWAWVGGKHNEVGKFDDDKRKHILQRAFTSTIQRHLKLNQRPGANTSITYVYRLLRDHINSKEQQLTDDLIALYDAFPQLNVGLLDSEIAAVEGMIAQKDFDSNNVTSELELLIRKSLSNDNLGLTRRVHIADIFKRTVLNKKIHDYYELQEQVRASDEKAIHYLVQLDLADPHNSSALHTIDMPIEWDITWAQLQTYRNLSDANGELLLALDLDWPAFGQLLAPQDADTAARLVTQGLQVDSETVSAALQAYRDTLTDDKKIAAIDAFVAELPQLREKKLLVDAATQLQRNNLLTTDNIVHPALKGTSPHDILENAIVQNSNASGRWDYLNKQHILSYHEWYVPAVTIISQLKEIGFTETQLREHIFTPAGFDKILQGKALHASDLTAIRQLVSAKRVEQRLRYFHRLNDQQRADTARHIQFLPLILQLESFVHTFIAQINSDATFLRAMELESGKESGERSELESGKESGESTGMFAPLALTLSELRQVHTASKRSKARKRRQATSPHRQLRNTLRKIAREMQAAQKIHLANTSKQEAKAIAQQQDERAKERQQAAAAKQQEQLRQT